MTADPNVFDDDALSLVVDPALLLPTTKPFAATPELVETPYVTGYTLAALGERSLAAEDKIADGGRSPSGTARGRLLYRAARLREA